MQGIRIKTISPAILHIGFSAVAALVWIVVFILKLTIEGLALISSFFQQSSALLSSMPALHFMVLLALACAVRLEVTSYVAGI